MGIPSDIIRGRPCNSSREQTIGALQGPVLSWHSLSPCPAGGNVTCGTGLTGDKVFLTDDIREGTDDRGSHRKLNHSTVSETVHKGKITKARRHNHLVQSPLFSVETKGWYLIKHTFILDPGYRGRGIF